MTKKRNDYEIFKQIVIILNKGPLNINQLHQVVKLKASLNRGLSCKLLMDFDVIPSVKPNFQFTNIPHPSWVLGFTEAEGSFNIILIKNYRVKTGINVRLCFALTQHYRDTELLISFIKYFETGSYFTKNMQKAADYRVNNLTDICEKIIPFFQQYSFLGSKSLSFNKFCLVAKIMQEKGHLNEQGLKKIKSIKSNTI